MTVLSSISSGIGEPLSRIDGPDKVSGRAKYAADHHAKDLAYGWIVSSAIAKGTIISIDETATRAVQGVVEVLTHKNRPHISWFNRSYRDEVAPPGGPFKPLYDNTVVFSFQPVALVVAETLEAARAGAALLQIHYETEQAETDFVACLSEAYVPAKKRIGIPMPANRGDAETAMQSVAHSVSSQYLMPPHRHNPMEPHATTVIFKDDGSLIVYDKTQGSQNIQSYLTRVFGLSKDKIIVRNPYVGGAFGSGLRPQNQVFLATMAALHLKRSVRVTMTRQQMVSHVHRPNAIQSVALGCDENGRLQAIVNKAITATSSYEDYMENVVNWALSAYQCENAIGEYKLVALDTPTPGDMRAPGAATGMNIFECAVDELASKVGIDPLEFRLINYTEVDAMSGKPFTSKELKRAYAAGAERFGWKGRPMEAGSKRDGHELIGWGMATGVWDAMFMKTSARARLSANGNLEIATAASDIGTGTYTILAQVASQTLGIPVEDISIKIGDSELPASPVEGGSWTAASSGAAVQLACQDVAEQLLKLATKLYNSPLTNAKVEDVQFCDHTLRLASDTSQALSIMDIFTKSQTNSLESREDRRASFDRNARYNGQSTQHSQCRIRRGEG